MLKISKRISCQQRIWDDVLLFTSFLRIFPLPDGLRSLCSRVGTLVLDAGEVLAIH